MTGLNQPSFLGRTDQLDARELDHEFWNIIKSQFNSIFHFFGWNTTGSRHPLDKFGPEIRLLLKAGIYYSTILRGNGTVGQQLMRINIKEGTPFWKKLCLIFLALDLIEYMKQRKRFLPDGSDSQLEKFQQAFQICSIANSLVFLQQGLYPTLTDRILGVTYEKVDSQQRSLSYEFMSRELLWHSAKEFLTFILPFVNFSKIQQIISQFLPQAKALPPQDDISALNQIQDCGFCRLSPVLPSRAGCKHTFCYFCISSNLLQTSTGLLCPTCKLELTQSKLNRVSFAEKIF